MKARLVGYTQPGEEFKYVFETPTDLIAFCARVSNPSNQLNNDTAGKLIKYLIDHRHWSPFEICSATVEVETTRDIARQLLRHRSFSFQEFSQRYADPTQMEFVIREPRMQDPKNRQKSIPFDMTDDKHITLDWLWRERQKNFIEQARELYQWALEHGIAKEQARCVLPEGCTPSRLYIQGTIRSYIHYIEVRTGEETQQEHRELAFAIAEAIKNIFDFKGIGR